MTGMRKRNINLVIRNKMDKWLKTLPEEIQGAVKKDVIVTGGCIASLLLGEPVNDFDVYFKTKSTTLLMANHYVDEFRIYREHKNEGVGYDIQVEELKDTIGRERIRIKVKSAGVAGETQNVDYQYFEGVGDRDKTGEYLDDAFDQPKEVEEEKPRPKYRPVFLSTNAITLSDGVQIIIRFWGDDKAIHENFDFVHCMNWWTYADGVQLNMESLEALMSKTLVYKGSLYPVCSVFRAKKFIQRGWSINAGQYLKMCLQIAKLNLESYTVLEEQLTGVDVAYFNQLLGEARNKDNPERVDTAYITEIINRMF